MCDFLTALLSVSPILVPMIIYHIYTVLRDKKAIKEAKIKLIDFRPVINNPHVFMISFEMEYNGYTIACHRRENVRKILYNDKYYFGDYCPEELLIFANYSEEEQKKLILELLNRYDTITAHIKHYKEKRIERDAQKVWKEMCDKNGIKED